MSGSPLNDLIQDLRRRSVVRVAAVYGAIAWAVLQFADMTFPRLGLPDWSIMFILILVAIGFPITLMLAWVFERGESGLAVTQPITEDERARLPRGRLFDVIVVTTLCIAIGWMYLDRLVWENPSPEQIQVPVETSQPDVPVVAEERPSIAVLPFDNLSIDENNAFFAAGMHEDILTHLSKIGDLKVISRTSVMKYANDETTSLTDIAAELGVKHILEGSVRRAGNQVRITVQLIDAQDDAHLWSSNFDRELENIFAVQTEVAEKIAETLEVELTAETIEKVTQQPTTNLAAYDLYLKGRERLQTREVESYRQAIVLFEKAIELDPDFAEAYAGVAETLGRLTELSDVFAEHREEIFRNANRAIALNPLSAEAHSALGFAYFWDGPQLKESIRAQRLAVSLEPNNPEYLVRLGRIHFLSGNIDEAKRNFDRALELDPLNANSLINLAGLLINHDNDLAMAYVERSMELEPKWSGPHVIASLIAKSVGDFSQTYRHLLAELETEPVSFSYFRMAAWFSPLGLHDLVAEHIEDAANHLSSDQTWLWYARMINLDSAYASPEDFNDEYLTTRRGILEQWLTTNPNDINARFSQSLQYSYEGSLLDIHEQPEAARSRYEESLTLITELLQPLRLRDGSLPLTNVSNFQVIQYFHLHWRLGRIDEVRDELRRVTDGYKNQLHIQATRLHLAVCYAMLDNKEEALYWLEQAYDHGENTIWIIQRYAPLNQYADDIRYKDLLARFKSRNESAAREILAIHNATQL